MIDDNQRDLLIQYRISQAKEIVEDAKLLLENQRLVSASNRIYYSMFNMLLALGLKYKFETSKHLQLIGWFNKNIIKEKILDAKYSRMLKKAYEYRTMADYNDFIDLKFEDISLMYDDMLKFITAIEEII